MADIQIKHFFIRALRDHDTEEALNRFLRGHQVLEVRQEFVAEAMNSAWCVAVRYAEGREPSDRARDSRRSSVDYKDVLEPEAFARFVELRERRKAIADDFGRRPKAGTASTAAVAGTTTPATAAARTATTTSRTTATTTSVSGWFLPPAQENGRMSPVDPGGDPVPTIPDESRDEVRDRDRALVARVDTRVERSRPLFLFPDFDKEDLDR